MPIFKPFKGVRAHKDYIECFPTHPLDNFTQEEIHQKAQEEHSFVKMVKPYVCSKSVDVDRNLRKVRHNYEELRAGHQLEQDPTSYYLYSQIMPDKTVFRGLLGLVSVDDFLNGKIKKHEETLIQKKEKLAQYLEKVNLQAEPVLLTYPSNSKVELLMNHEEKSVPIHNYLDSRGIRHKIWRIDNRLKLQQLKEVFDQIEAFYIADGHHRMGSTALNAEQQREKNKKYNGNEPYNYIYSYIVSNQSIKIHDFNKLVVDLNDLTSEEFLKRLEESFTIHEKGETPYYPSQKYHISMYLEGKFYSLHIKHELRPKENCLDTIDLCLLEKLVMKNILGIENTRDTDRIAHLKGCSTVEGIKKLKDKVDSGKYKVAFGICPVTFTDLLKIADEGLKMPPKGTYIEPKLITGLIMYDMKQE